jgi:hypothetical protein
MEHDHITLNMRRIRRLPLYRKPATYHLQQDPGNGCDGDPPGYPTYFTQSVFTQYGNKPPRGPQLVLLGHVVDDPRDWRTGDTWDTLQARKEALLRKLYSPLPIEHPRVQAWITKLYKHSHSCYTDDSKPHGDNLVIFPVPDYELKTFKDDPRFSDEWRVKERAAIEQANRDIIAAARKIAVYNNHRAVRAIQVFYPEFSAPVSDYENLPHPGNWWERHSRNFTPEECPGQYNMKHPVNGTWCQVCGWNNQKRGVK